MKQRYKVSLVVFVVVVVAAIAIGFGLAGSNKQKSHIYVMPDGYIGWVQIIYNQKDSPELPKEGKAFLHNIPKDGVLRTSSPATSGGMTFYYADEQGKRTEISSDMIQGQSIGTKEIKRSDGTMEEAQVNSFFVGTEQQYKEQIPKTQ
ncbi:hypothetical protein ABEV74_14650 [Paenibacillus cisolokensis]|uniref:DUF6843 domain-containing protein n=1 Tax=Paenibacillus cisolokensis TaxID=1658519 RepID=UPI003D2B5F1D